MGERLTDRLVKALPVPTGGSKITYDTEVKGFAARVTANGSRAFIVRYRIGGQGRLFTIGSFPDWSTSAARDEARALKKRVDKDEDPMAERHEKRAAPTVNELIDHFVTNHLPKRRESTIRDYRSILEKLVRPELGRMKVAEVEHADIDRLHRKVSERTPYRANRMAAVISKMMNFAIKLKWRADNPVRGLERNNEDRRERYLAGAELMFLSAALQEHSDQRSADAIRLLLLTGARRGEVLGATWDMFDLDAGVWTKPSAATKQKKSHRVPLSASALQLLVSIRQRHADGQPFVFPGDKAGAHLTDIKKTWAAVVGKATVLQWASQPESAAGRLVARLQARKAADAEAKGKKPNRTLPTLAECRKEAKAAGLDLPAGLTNARAHDLRHTYASIIVSGGGSLPLIGALLGHTQVSTTQRYSHLFDDPLRAATERVGAFIEALGAPQNTADVVPLRKR